MNPAIKIALIALAGTVVAALVTAAATLGGAQIQAGAAKPSQSTTPSPTMSTNNQNAQPIDAVSNSSSPTYSPSETPSDEPSPEVPSNEPSSERPGNEPSPSPSPPSKMIKDLIPLIGDWEEGKSQIDGKKYANTIWPPWCDQGSSQTYIISKKYKRLKAIIGIDDYSKITSPVYFTITGGDETIYNQKIYPGPPSIIDVPVSGVVRLILSTEIDDKDADCSDTYAIWANTRLEK